MNAGPARLAVMLSGSGRTLMNLVEHVRFGRLHAEIPLAIASRECLGADRAREAGIQTLIVPGVIPASELSELLRSRRIDWVVLAGYLRFIEVPPAYRGRIVNIHPALLPQFGGAGMYGDRVHEAVLRSGATESGCTVHMVDDEFDRGPIVLQKRCPVLPGDTVRTLADRVFALETTAYPEALAMLLGQTQSGTGQ